jgi:hypothetical protein
LGIDLSSQETVLKYIGGLHNYLRHTILMFNPTNLDEFCVQETHLEARGRNEPQEVSKKPFVKGDKGKKKFKGNGRKNASVKKEGEKLSCKHCSKDDHNEDHCWKLHPEMRPKNFSHKGKPKTTTTTQYDLGYDSGDETKITTMGFQGNDSIASTSYSSSSSLNETQHEKERIEIFHIRVISKHTKIDTLFDTVSQTNLISEETIKKLKLETTPHPKPYTLVWICDNAKLHVTRRCKIIFSITANFIDEVECYTSKLITPMMTYCDHYQCRILDISVAKIIFSSCLCHVSNDITRTLKTPSKTSLRRRNHMTKSTNILTWKKTLKSHFWRPALPCPLSGSASAPFPPLGQRCNILCPILRECWLV